MIIFLLFLFLNSHFYFAQDFTSIDKSDIQDNNVSLVSNWKYTNQDDAKFKDPEFDDSGWKSINPMLPPDSIDENIKGVYWFRLNLKVSEELLDSALGMRIYLTGPMEIYLNGVLLKKIGKVGINKEEEERTKYLHPIPVVFDERDNVIAVRFSNSNAQLINRVGVMQGFVINLGNISRMIEEQNQLIRGKSISQLFFISVPLIIAFIHLSLFFFYPKHKENLYYFFFLISFVFFTYIGYNSYFEESLDRLFFLYRFGAAALISTLIFASATLYSMFSKLPKYFYIYAIIGGLITLIAFIRPGSYIWIISYGFITVIAFFAGNVIFSPAKKGEISKKVVRVGFALFSITGIYQMLIAMDVISPIGNFYQAFNFGVLAFIFSMSIALAYNFAKMNRDLEKQLIQVKELSEKTLSQEREARELEIERRVLESDNDRKTNELEEARELQLSLVPKKAPTFKNYNIAVSMRTATEVGGDYYDFKEVGGTLTTVVGDATGHGMKAGQMVISVKSLFNALPGSLSIPDFFNKCTDILKDMKLKKLYMSMTVLKISGNKVTLSSAGMPPVLIFRADGKFVEELKIKGMPLGAYRGFPYETAEIFLEDDDFLLIMTDGLLELFNKEQEMFGLERIKRKILELSGENPPKIIDELYSAGDRWLNTQNQNDDITLTIIKRETEKSFY